MVSGVRFSDGSPRRRGLHIVRDDFSFEKSSLIYSVAPPFQITTAVLGCDLAFGGANLNIYRCDITSCRGLHIVRDDFFDRDAHMPAFTVLLADYIIHVVRCAQIVKIHLAVLAFVAQQNFAFCLPHHDAAKIYLLHR